MRDIIDAVINEPAAAGALIWSLRFHDNDGGYYWHHEPHGGDFFKAYHWPGGPMGEPYDETRFMKMVRDKAYEIQKQAPAALKTPAAPELIQVTESGIVNWRGAAGGSELQPGAERASERAVEAGCLWFDGRCEPISSAGGG